MKKRKKIILVVSIFLSISLGIAIILFVNMRANNQRRAVDKAIHDVLEMEYYGGEDSEEIPEYLSSMKEKSGYEVVNVEKKDGIYTATVTVYAPNLYEIVKKMDDSHGQNPLGEEMDKAITKEVKKADVVTQDMQIVLVEKNGEYEVFMEEEFVNAYYGGILQLRKEYIKTLWEEMNK